MANNFLEQLLEAITPEGDDFLTQLSTAVEPLKVEEDEEEPEKLTFGEMMERGLRVARGEKFAPIEKERPIVSGLEDTARGFFKGITEEIPRRIMGQDFVEQITKIAPQRKREPIFLPNLFPDKTDVLQEAGARAAPLIAGAAISPTAAGRGIPALTRLGFGAAQGALEELGPGVRPEDVALGAAGGAGGAGLGAVVGRLGRTVEPGRPPITSAAIDEAAVVDAIRQVESPIEEVIIGPQRLLEAGEVIQELGPGPASLQLGPGAVAFDTLAKGAGEGHTPSFRSAATLAGASNEEVNLAISTLSRTEKGRIASKALRGQRFSEYLEELVGGRPAGSIPNADTEIAGIAALREQALLGTSEVIEPESILGQNLRLRQGVLSPELERFVDRLRRRRPFSDLKGSPQFQVDTMARKSLRASGLGKKEQDKILFSLSPSERFALAQKHVQAGQDAAKKVTRVVEDETGKAQPTFRQQLEDSLLQAEASRSPITGEEGMLIIGRMADNLPLTKRTRVRGFLEKIGKREQDAVAVWYNSLLLNPATIIRNLMGNTMELAELATSRTIRGAGKGSFRQALAQWSGFGHGLFEAWRSAGEAWRSGLIRAIREGTEVIEDLPTAVQRAAARGETTLAAKLPASKILSSMDDFYTTLAYHMDLHDRVFRRATSKGLRGSALEGEVTRLLNDVPDDISRESIRAARRVVFRDAPANIFEQRALKAIRGIQDIPVLGRFALPFGPTLLRIGKRTLEYTPLNYANAIAQALAGNMEQTALASIRGTYGLVGMTGLSLLAWNDLISGEGNHLTDSQRAVQRKAGWQPFSFKFGDRWVSYRNLGPVTGVLRMVADSVEDIKNGESTGEAVSKIPGNVLEAAIEATFLPGLTELVNAVVEPDRYGGPGLNSILEVMQPSSGAAALARAIDPTIRDPKRTDPEEVMASRVPGLSQQLRPKLGLFGEEISRSPSGGVGLAEGVELFLSPVRRSQIVEDPVILEAARLQASLTPPSIGGEMPKGRELTDDEDFLARKAMGTVQRSMVTRAVMNPGYQLLDDDRKREFMQKAHSKGRNAVRNRLKILLKTNSPLTFRNLTRGFILTGAQ